MANAWADLGITDHRNEALAPAYASHPFDSPQADVIIRSSDNVDFRVIKLFLSFASPFFRDMFALPQMPEGENSNEMSDGLPLITVTETSKTLESLFLLCYPVTTVDPPVLELLEDVHALLDAATKYSVEGVERRVKQWLVAPRFLCTDPVRVFAIACRYKLQEEAIAAAKASFRQPLLRRPYGAELELITGGQLYQLLHYHERCMAAAKTVAADFIWIERTNACWFDCGNCSKGKHIKRIGNNRMPKYCTNWWLSYTEEVTGSFADQTLEETKETKLLEAALYQASQCTYCCPRVLTELREYRDTLMSRIETVVSEVSNSLRKIICMIVASSTFLLGYHRSSVLKIA